jgi:hypothetical protein
MAATASDAAANECIACSNRTISVVIVHGARDCDEGDGSEATAHHSTPFE